MATSRQHGVKLGDKAGQARRERLSVGGPISFISAFSRADFGAANRKWTMVPALTGSSSMVWSTFTGPLGVSSVTRLMTITSVCNVLEQDAVRFTARRSP